VPELPELVAHLLRMEVRHQHGKNGGSVEENGGSDRGDRVSLPRVREKWFMIIGTAT
jgi:hypothetical protein